MMSSKHTDKKGFTLVELTLAMAFLAILLITIAILIIRIVSIYQSGLTIRSVSSTGRQLIDDFTRSISGSPIVGVSYDPDAEDALFSDDFGNNDRITYKYYFQKTGRAVIRPESGDEIIRDDAPLAGGFCTGRYSYLWNTAYALQGGDEDFAGFTYSYGDKLNPTVLTQFKLIRIPDDKRSICIDQRIGSDDKRISNKESNFTDPRGLFDLSASPNSADHYAPVELLGSAEDELALYDFRIFPASSNRLTGHIFYSGTFILATLRGGVDIFTSGNYCTEEYGTLNTDFNYCAINKFNFAMRATGGSTDDRVYGER